MHRIGIKKDDDIKERIKKMEYRHHSRKFPGLLKICISFVYDK